MSTPQDRQRTDAFRAWLKHIGSIDAAHAATGIAIRSLERMRSGQKPPPAHLLEVLARDCNDQRLFEQLHRAAQPVEATDA